MSIVGFLRFFIADRWIGHPRIITTGTDSPIKNQVVIGAIGYPITREIPRLLMKLLT